MTMTWEIRKDKEVKAHGSGDILAAYSAETLKQMRAAGYKVYVDGKVKK